MRQSHEVESPRRPRHGGPARGMRRRAAGVAGCAERAGGRWRERRAAIRGAFTGRPTSRSSRAVRRRTGSSTSGWASGTSPRRAAPAGTNVVEPLLGGCAIRENYLDPAGRFGGHEPQQLRRRHEAVAADLGSRLRGRLPDGGRPRCLGHDGADGRADQRARTAGCLLDTWKWTPVDASTMLQTGGSRCRRSATTTSSGTASITGWPR